jgi:hypothetical protein
LTLQRGRRPLRILRRAAEADSRSLKDPIEALCEE